MAGMAPLAGGCGVSTVRVTPRATTQPCVYWPGSGEPLSDLISAGCGHFELASRSSRRGHFPMPASLASSGIPAMVDVLDGGGCKAHSWNLICYCPIIRGQRPSCRSSMAGQSRSPKIEQFVHYRCDCQSEAGHLADDEVKARPVVLYCALIQLSEPASFTATSEMKICRGLPSAVPRCSVEIEYRTRLSVASPRGCDDAGLLWRRRGGRPFP